MASAQILSEETINASKAQSIPTRSADGTAVPVLGFGTYQMNSLETFSATRRALDLGYRHIDTAMAYDNEAAVGRAIATSAVDREEVFLTTKIKGYPELLQEEPFLEAAQQCMERLGTEFIDLLLIHWWHPKGDMPATCAALDRLHEAGTVRHVGVSNFSVQQLKRAIDLTDTPILTNQIEYHAYRPRDELIAYCRKNDVLVTAYSPLAEGRLVSDATLAAIGDRYEKTAAQVAIRWLIQQDGVVTIPKASNAGHQIENRDVFDFELTDAEMQTIAALDGPLFYRLNAPGGLIQRSRHWAGQFVPANLRAALP